MQRGGARHTTRKYQVRRRPRQVVRGFAGVPLGEVSGGILTRIVSDKHLFRALDAWSMGAVGVDRCRRAGVQTLRYVKPGEGTYAVPLADFIERAERRKFPTNDETQFLLARKWWLFLPSTPRPTSQQQSLFAVAG